MRSLIFYSLAPNVDVCPLFPFLSFSPRRLPGFLPKGIFFSISVASLSLPTRCCLVLGLEREGHHYYCFSPQVLLFVASFLELQDMAAETRDTVISGQMCFVCSAIECIMLGVLFPLSVRALSNWRRDITYEYVEWSTKQKRTLRGFFAKKPFQRRRV